MSAWPEEPDHFLNWLRGRDRAYEPGSFAPRKLYGDYLEELLRDAETRQEQRLVPIRTEITDLIEEAPGAITLLARDGARFEADAVVLAMGNPEPRDPIPVPASTLATGSYISNPWADDPLRGMSLDQPIVVIGSGLTAVDLIVDARERGFAGKITVVSRHGLFPQAHARVPTLTSAIPSVELMLPLTARGLLREIRRRVRSAQQQGRDWRPVIDALRPGLPGLWKSSNVVEKERFLRHLAAYWEVHRHRVAPDIDEIIQQDRRQGRLTVIAGRLRAICDHADGVDVVVSRRGRSDREVLVARRVINCTGPSKDVRTGYSVLVSALLERGLAAADPLGLGLVVDENGALVASNGRNHGRVFALGSMLRGMYWETTAVRELRQQAADLARHLIEMLRPASRGLLPDPHWNLVGGHPAARVETRWLLPVRKPSDHGGEIR
jgi:uncharacterized NAD(P)/FAD-binding protein YdhS